MVISLSPETERLLGQRLKAGDYSTADEVIRAALLLLDEDHRDRAACGDSVRAKLMRAAEEADEGKLVDGEAAFTGAIDRLKAYQQADAS